MARPGGNPNLKGNKNSGRKSHADEAIKALVLNKAWGKILKRMRDMKDEDIEKLALPIVLRNIPQDVKANVAIIYPKPLLGGQSNGGDNNSDKETTETG